jgi:hypothetical protein
MSPALAEPSPPQIIVPVIVVPLSVNRMVPRTVSSPLVTAIPIVLSVSSRVMRMAARPSDDGGWSLYVTEEASTYVPGVITPPFGVGASAVDVVAVIGAAFCSTELQLDELVLAGAGWVGASSMTVPLPPEQPKTAHDERKTAEAKRKVFIRAS